MWGGREKTTSHRGEGEGKRLLKSSSRQYHKPLIHKTDRHVKIVVVVVMEISTAPYLLKILQPKARTKAIQTTIT